MPRYLVRVSYTEEGTQGLLRDGGTRRREELASIVESLDGELEGLYYALGEHDAYALVELPNPESVVAASMLAKASGTGVGSATVLLTPEQIDRASELAQNLDYQPPGQ